MLSKADNERLTRFGPGTPMGEMLREFWHPAARSAALEADGAPKRVRLLGENFVAFRATDGRVGFFQENCPHRGAARGPRRACAGQTAVRPRSELRLQRDPRALDPLAVIDELARRRSPGSPAHVREAV